MSQMRPWGTALAPQAVASIQHGTLRYAYKGTPLLKDPFDLALYPLLLWNLKPRTIIEIGSFAGGSACWFGDQLNSLGIDGHVHSFDIRRPAGVSHPRVTFWEADGRDLAATITPELLASLPRPWLVIEDADHHYETTRNVLAFFHAHLRPNEYVVVEDGIVSDMGGDAQYNGGPGRALLEFLTQHAGEYAIDTQYCDYFGHNFTWCTNGFIRKLEARA